MGFYLQKGFLTLFFTSWHQKKIKVVIIDLVNPVLELPKQSGMNKIEVSVSNLELLLFQLQMQSVIHIHP